MSQFDHHDRIVIVRKSAEMYDLKRATRISARRRRVPLQDSLEQKPKQIVARYETTFNFQNDVLMALPAHALWFYINGKCRRPDIVSKDTGHLCHIAGRSFLDAEDPKFTAS